MDITRYRGDTKSFRVVITDNGEPIDLTACTVKLTVNSNLNPTDSSTQLFQLTGTFTDPTNGIAVFSIGSNADHVGYFFFDIQVTDNIGETFTVTKGAFTMLQDITKN